MVLLRPVRSDDRSPLRPVDDLPGAAQVKCYETPNIWELNEDMPDGPDPFFIGITDSIIWEDEA